MSNATGKQMYSTLCATLDGMNWKYTKEEDKGVVRTSARGKDLTMNLYMKVDGDREVMYVKSPMPFDVPEDVRGRMASAILVANYSMLNGSFEFDFEDGWTAFKIVIPFMETVVSTKVCEYMIRLTCAMVDKFNDKFMAVCNGSMSLSEFIEFTKNN